MTLLMKQRYWNPIVDGSSHAGKTLSCIDWVSRGYHCELLELMNYSLKFTTWWQGLYGFNKHRALLWTWVHASGLCADQMFSKIWHFHSPISLQPTKGSPKSWCFPGASSKLVEKHLLLGPVATLGTWARPGERPQHSRPTCFHCLESKLKIQHLCRAGLGGVGSV